ncbi:MAG: hypothetical protein DMG55_24815 [Acidobacteria bacterium]|nr:MAG: hypothetical protein DMG55_24815 [Acidobacteriota bacterium]
MISKDIGLVPTGAVAPGNISVGVAGPRRHQHEWRVVSAVEGEVPELGAVDQAGRDGGLPLDSQLDGQFIVDVQ